MIHQKVKVVRVKISLDFLALKSMKVLKKVLWGALMVLGACSSGEKSAIKLEELKILDAKYWNAKMNVNADTLELKVKNAFAFPLDNKDSSKFGVTFDDDYAPRNPYALSINGDKCGILDKFHENIKVINLVTGKIEDCSPKLMKYYQVEDFTSFAGHYVFVGGFDQLGLWKEGWKNVAKVNNPVADKVKGLGSAEFILQGAERLYVESGDQVKERPDQHNPSRIAFVLNRNFWVRLDTLDLDKIFDFDHFELMIRGKISYIIKKDGKVYYRTDRGVFILPSELYDEVLDDSTRRRFIDYDQDKVVLFGYDKGMLMVYVLTVK